MFKSLQKKRIKNYEWYKNYYNENKDKILEFQKNYREINKEHIKKRSSNYYKKNKDEINLKKLKKVYCHICDSLYASCTRKRHLLTLKHQNNINLTK